MAEWLRDGNLVYRLREKGRRKGEPVMENRTAINFVGDGAEDLAAKVQAFLNDEVSNAVGGG